MANITREHVNKLISKLKATESSKQSKHHKHYDVWHDDKVIITFGVSHTAKKSKPQNHIPGQLFLSRNDTKKMAECNIDRDEYVRMLQDQGVA